MIEHILHNVNLKVIVLKQRKKSHFVYFINERMKKLLPYNIKSKFNIDDILINIHNDYKENETNSFNDFINKKIDFQSYCKILVNEQYEWYEIHTKYYNIKKLFIITFQNINELKLHENDYNTKSLFLANVNHELRTPLNGIVGMITLLEDTQINNEQQDYINMLKECSINLLTIINDVLDFSKLEAGKVQLDIKCISLQECIESINDILSLKILDKNLNYSYSIDTHIPTYLYIDINRLKQILLNILYNAIKFTDKGSITLNIYKIETLSNNEIYIQFDITDTGCGINNIDNNKLFKSFSQIDNNKTLNEGTGLGLSICKQLVSLMNGNIWLNNSIVDKGSTFSFTIKTLQCENNNNNQFINIECLKNRTVFILDDNRENRIGLVNMVSKWGMIPIPFSSAIEALYMIKLKLYKFDIGFVDICMPEMSGENFASKLFEYNKDIPLIALSSSDSFKNITYFKEQLNKPITEKTLKKICFDIFKNKQISTIVEHEINNIQILLVEDIYINQKVVLKFLNKLGYNNVDIVDDGKQCLDMLTKKQYDLILLDIKIPIINGENVLIYIKNYYQNQNQNPKWILKNKHQPYIIAVTAYSLKDDREKYLSIGFNEFIPKPISITKLEQVMDNFINHLLI